MVFRSSLTVISVGTISPFATKSLIKYPSSVLLNQIKNEGYFWEYLI